MSPSRSGAGRQGRGVVGDRLTSGKLFIGAAQRWVFRQVSTGFPVRRSAPPRSSPATAQNAAGVPQNTAGMLLLTAVILLEPHGAGTKYTAIAIHGDEEGANSTRTWASTTIGAKADQLVTLAKKNARVRVGLTTILIIGKSGAPTTGNQHYRGPQLRHRCGPKVCGGNLSPYKRAVDSNAGQALASGQISERTPVGGRE